MSKFDDMLAKKKTVVPVLDLSRNIIQSKEEYKRLMDKVPEFKMRPIKVRSDEIKIKEKDFSFKMPRKEARKLLKAIGERELMYAYADPIPSEMKDIVLMELCVVPIEWKMLTNVRPKSKIEEEYFGRMIEMGKLQIKTQARDKREALANNCVKKIKNKSGIVERRIQTCSECGEEMCYGKSCTEFSYDIFARIVPKPLKVNPAPTSSFKGNLTARKKFAADVTKLKSNKNKKKNAHN